jgi:hypothetical protein
MPNISEVRDPRKWLKWRESGAVPRTLPKRKYANCYCDKCGRPVPASNDAVLLQVLLSKDPDAALWMLFTQPRHLLPVVENGVTVCEGSPSRAQYLPGQPRDKRGYRYIPEGEAKYRSAFRKMQASGHEAMSAS